MDRLRLVIGRLASRRALARYGAPAAFLLAVTIALLLVRAGLNGNDSSAGPTVPTVTAPPTIVATTVATTGPERPVRKRYYRIRSGDTLDLIALRFGTTVDRLLVLNPGIEPTALTPGQRVRIR